MIDIKECKKCFYYTEQITEWDNDGITAFTKPACSKVKSPSEHGLYWLIDEIETCPLELETKPCVCAICNKQENVSLKTIGINTIYIHFCKECKDAIKYAKKLKKKKEKKDAEKNEIY